MVHLYKAFLAVRTVLCLGFLAGLLPAHAMAQSPAAPEASLFTVENVVVDVTADNALQAREKAFEEAQVKAFGELAARMLPESARAGFTPPPAPEISPMILDYEVTNEKLSSKRYIGTYTFRFGEQAVTRYFDVKGVNNYRVAAVKPLLILPFLEQDGRTTLWSPYNLWMKAWTETGEPSLIVPIGDLSDVADIGDDDAPDYNGRGLSSMLARYGAGEAAIAIARPAADGASVNIELYRTDRGESEFAGNLAETAPAGGDPSVLYAAAVRHMAEILRQDWKNGEGLAQAALVPSAPADSPSTLQPPSSQSSETPPLPQASGGNSVSVRAAFTTLQEWAAIQRALARAGGISDIMLRAISPREAVLDLVYSGDMSQLELALAQVDLALSGPSGQAGGAPVYDLAFRGAAPAADPVPPAREPSLPYARQQTQTTPYARGGGYQGSF